LNPYREIAVHDRRPPTSAFAALPVTSI